MDSLQKIWNLSLIDVDDYLGENNLPLIDKYIKISILSKNSLSNFERELVSLKTFISVMREIGRTNPFDQVLVKGLVELSFDYSMSKLPDELIRGIKDLLAFKPKNNEELRKAVKIYYKNSEESRRLYGPMELWNTVLITDMKYLFRQMYKFNTDISNWDVSNVTNMSEMFSEAKLFNQPLNKWNISNVTDMSFMFYKAESFNQSLDKWIISKVTNMSFMFAYTKLFNQPLNKWDVANVTDMNNMFFYALSFNQSLDKWNISKVTDMSYMFYMAKCFNQPLNKWVNIIDSFQYNDNELKSVEKFTHINNMFSGASSYTYGPLG